MNCTKCKSTAHIICPLNLNCPCCLKTLSEIIEDDPKSAAILIQRLNIKNGKKNNTKNTSNVSLSKQ